MNRFITAGLLIACGTGASGCDASYEGSYSGSFSTTVTKPLGPEQKLKTEIKDGRGRVSIVPAVDEDAEGTELAAFDRVLQLRAGRTNAGAIEVCASGKPQRIVRSVRLAGGVEAPVLFQCTDASRLQASSTETTSSETTQQRGVHVQTRG